MTGRPRITLVAKPWRGGLARYLRAALEARYPGCVTWIPLYPESIPGLLRYRRDRAAWRMRLAERIDALRDDVTICVNLLPEFAGLGRRARSVLWLTDSGEAAHAGIDPFARVFVSDPGYLDEVRARAPAHAEVAVLPFGFEPSLHAPTPSAGPVHDALCFVANADPKRDEHLRALLINGPRVDVFGNHHLRRALFWRHPRRFHAPVSNESMGKIYARYAASLNVHAGIVRAGTNMRTFECAGYGIAQLVEHRPGLEAYFEPETEITVYHEPAELPDAAARLLQDASRRDSLASRARARAMAEHTYRHRVDTMLAGIIDDPGSDAG